MLALLFFRQQCLNTLHITPSPVQTGEGRGGGKVFSYINNIPHPSPPPLSRGRE